MIESRNIQPPASFRILLIGDSCVDEYVYGYCSRLNPEAPVPVLDYTKTEYKAGMAGNVYENLKAFKLEVDFITNKEKIVKTRYVDAKYNQQILRVDRHEVLAPLKDDLLLNNYDAIVISDYNKGFISEEQLFGIAEKALCPVFIDTKKTNLPVKDNCFIKVNEAEYKALANHPENLIVTLGERGAKFRDVVYPTDKVTVFDVVGAGDTFLAALTYFYLTAGTVEKAIPYANKASTVAVQHTGTYVLNGDDVEKILSQSKVIS